MSRAIVPDAVNFMAAGDHQQALEQSNYTVGVKLKFSFNKVELIVIGGGSKFKVGGGRKSGGGGRGGVSSACKN